MTLETVKQYQREERTLMANRMKVEQQGIEDLLEAMKNRNLIKTFFM